MDAPHHIFNRRRVKMHRDRAAQTISAHDFLLRDLAERLCDRLSDMTQSFPLALDLGAHHGLLGACLAGRGGIEWMVQSDLSLPLLTSRTTNHEPRITTLVADEEWLPFAEGSFDAVFSLWSLHWVNDLVGTLVQIKRILKPGGLFLAIVPGGETLKELRQSFEQAELAVRGGISPRISPFMDVRDAGSLLQRAGFAEPVIDSDTLTVLYEDGLKLMHDLRDMGEGNALMASAKGFTRRDVFFAALDYYQKHFKGRSGRVMASFELVAMTGWKS